ncbi:BgTH12-04016 [Blumeria graminis f. sp. triticale]|uniref:BgTH12-04016 n=1 Tax=Blumeria graminis f. sp. triticale TaxID=1689686 RepID=A0A9W4GCQ1_BLUGR|nr:BgTH12-04016 [Blumeria graminis f. sp. triticale]
MRSPNVKLSYRRI